MKEIWGKIKTYLNPFYLVAAAFALGIIYGLTEWAPIGWLLAIVAVPLVIGAIIGIMIVWIINPIRWVIKKIKDRK